MSATEQTIFSFTVWLKFIGTVGEFAFVNSFF